VRDHHSIWLSVFVLCSAVAAGAAAPRVQLHPAADAWTAFADGDELVAVGGGEAQWIRDGSVLATVHDPLGLAGAGVDPERPLFLTDAEGNRVVAFVPGMDLSLTDQPPAIVHFK